MTTTVGRPRLQVSVNGVILATAGIENHGVLSVIVTWLARSPGAICDGHRQASDFDEEEFLAEVLDVSLGGLGGSDGIGECLNWLESSPLKVGDEVTIRVLPPGEVDEPVRRRWDNAA